MSVLTTVVGSYPERGTLNAEPRPVEPGLWYKLPCMTSRSRTLILVAALVGLGFAGASLQVHHRLLTDPSYTSFCDVNATFNCSQVYLSQYGSFQGVSTALFGMIWFGVALPRPPPKAACPCPRSPRGKRMHPHVEG